ncbi:MAG: hypothetical protein K9J12_02345 [Melioribacteraceae bacterium]|nr:hypothetical protein [Melioribacteraceae bacterium]MCF8263869.1 hypothetical protein [Melioribacteraceae bacterium]MCF8412405.1 hypothetical protein [Melioribacteraceae bacterium]
MEEESKTAEYFENEKKTYERKTVYSGFGWFLFTFVGISAVPQKVEFYERETGKKVASFSDEETRKKYVGR